MSSPGLIIGSRVSITALSDDTRYEGTVTQVDSEQKTVRLDTEDRVPMGPNFRPPLDTLYEFVIFKAGDIKDITVLKNLAPPMGGRQGEDRGTADPVGYMPYNSNPNAGYMFQQSPNYYPYGYNYGPYGYGQPPPSAWGMGQYANYGVVNYPPMWQGDGMGEDVSRRKDVKGPESVDEQGVRHPYSRPGVPHMPVPYGMPGLAMPAPYGMQGLHAPGAHSVPPGISSAPQGGESDVKPAQHSEPAKQPEATQKKLESAAPAPAPQPAPQHPRPTQQKEQTPSQPSQKTDAKQQPPSQPQQPTQKTETKQQAQPEKSKEPQQKQSQAQTPAKAPAPAQAQPQAQQKQPQQPQTQQSQAQKKQQPQQQQRGQQKTTKTVTYQPKQQQPEQKQEQNKQQEQKQQEQQRQQDQKQQGGQRQQQQQPQQQPQQPQKPTNPWGIKGIGAAVVSGNVRPTTPIALEPVATKTSNASTTSAPPPVAQKGNNRSANTKAGSTTATKNNTKASTTTSAKAPETPESASTKSESWRSNGMPTTNPWGVPNTKPIVAKTNINTSAPRDNKATNIGNKTTKPTNTNRTTQTASTTQAQAPTSNPWNRGSNAVVSTVAYSSSAPRALQELDIAAGNEKWDKEKFFTELEAERERVQASKVKKHRPVDEFFDSLSSGPVYDPEGDFFDTISSEVLEDKSIKKKVDKAKEFNDQKKLDVSTFGLAEVNATYTQLQAQLAGGAQPRPSDQGSRPPARSPAPASGGRPDYNRPSNPSYNRGGRTGGYSTAPHTDSYKGRQPIQTGSRPAGSAGASTNTGRGGRSYAAAVRPTRGR